MRTSVIIPTYNRAHLVPRAIRSVVAQSSGNWELIVVDDGSTDNTGEVMAEFLSDKRIKYFRKNNSGAAESRNVGVEMAGGVLITFLDSDDEAEPAWLEKMTETLRRNEAAVVCCGLRRFNHKGELLGIDMPVTMAPTFQNISGRFTHGGVFLLQREIFLAIGGFDPELRSGQHTEMSYRLIPYLIQHGMKIVNIMEPLIKAHVHDGPRIRYNNEAIFLGSTRTLQKHEALFKKDKKKYINYLSVAGVCGVRTRRYSQASAYFLKAVGQDPSNFQLWFRYVISHLPIIRDYVWRKDGRRSE